MLEALLVPVLMYGRQETMLWKEKDKSTVRAKQMYNLRGLLGIMNHGYTDKGVMRSEEGSR